MSNYVKATNFTAKDSLPSGNAGKIIKGSEIDTEYTAIASAISSKADLNSPALTATSIFWIDIGLPLTSTSKPSCMIVP